MTDQLHQDLVALADRARIGPLDLAGVHRAATVRRRRRRHASAFAAVLAACALVVVPTVRSHTDAARPELLTPPPVAAGSPPAPEATIPAATSGYVRAHPGDPQVRRLLQIADQQASPARAVQVLALHTDAAGYSRLTGTDPGPYFPADIWLLQVSGDTYTHSSISRTLTGTHLTLTVDATTDTLASYALSPSALPLPAGPNGAMLLRG